MITLEKLVELEIAKPECLGSLVRYETIMTDVFENEPKFGLVGMATYSGADVDVMFYDLRELAKDAVIEIGVWENGSAHPIGRQPLH